MVCFFLVPWCKMKWPWCCCTCWRAESLWTLHPGWALRGPEETLLVNLAFHFHDAQLLCWKEEPGVGGKALVLSLGSATLNIRVFILKMKMETPPGYSGIFFSLFIIYFIFFKIRSWPTKLISWPNHWSWKSWHSSYLIIFFFLGNTRIWTWNVSVQHLCITRITSPVCEPMFLLLWDKGKKYKIYGHRIRNALGWET